MTDSRRTWSLVASVTLGIGTALVVLFAGGQPAVAAVPGLGSRKPAPALNICFARDDSNTGTVYQSSDAGAVRSAAAAAVAGDVVRLAGTCNGAAVQLGSEQTVAITRPLTLIGGYTQTNFIQSFPITQPTVLNAQYLGRVISASTDITLGALTAEDGTAFDANGGAVFVHGNLTSLGAVSLLNSTTLPPTPQQASASPLAPADGGGSGGGAFVSGALRAVPTLGALVADDNTAGQDGGGLYVTGASSLTNAQINDNTADQFGGGLYANGPLTMTNAQVNDNTAVSDGGGWTMNSSGIISDTQCNENTADANGGCFEASNGNAVNISNLTTLDNSANQGGVGEAYQATVTVAASKFVNDNAATAGGGFYITDGHVTLYNDSFSDVSAPRGGAVAATKFTAPNPTVTIQLVTTRFLSETARAAGAPTTLSGSAFAAAGANLLITDTIVSGYALDYETDNGPSSTIHGDYDLFDVTPVISGTHVTTGTHSLVGNPLFADAAGHLSAGSPAINHGIDVGINVDLDGHHRPSGGGFDIGAYEFQAALYKLFLPFVTR